MVLSQTINGTKFFIRGKGIIFVFTPKLEGYVITAINPKSNDSYGYVYISNSEIQTLLNP